MHLVGRAQIQSQIGIQQSQITRLGRQLADHVVSDTAIRPIQPSTADRCPVRIPLELFINMSSRSSPECSPPCQGGDQAFKSPRGRISKHAAVRNPAKRRSSNLRGLWVRLPLASLSSIALTEHWRAQVAVTHPPPGFGASTPSRRTHFQFLSSRVGQCVSSGQKVGQYSGAW